MYLLSLGNFFKTFLAAFGLIYRQDRPRFVGILVLYLFAVVLFMGSICLVYLVTKSMLQQDNRLEIDVFGFSSAISFSYVFIIVIIVLYLMSSFLLYLSETLWYNNIHRILLLLSTENVGDRSQQRTKDLSVGALAVFQSSRRVLGQVFPSLVSVACFVILMWFDVWITLFVFAVMLAYIGVVTRYGRVAKSFDKEGGVEDDDDYEAYSDVSRSMDSSSLASRLDRQSSYYKLKTKTNLVGNVVFVVVMAIIVVAIQYNGADAEALLDIGFYLVLLNMMYKGAKSTSIASITLSRKYGRILKYVDEMQTKPGR